MDNISCAAILMTTLLLLVVGLLLVHMIASRGPDARLQFLLDLMADFPASGDQPGTSSPAGAPRTESASNVTHAPGSAARSSMTPVRYAGRLASHGL
jgi:hypothetical protein